jgi:hypothetical protein
MNHHQQSTWVLVLAAAGHLTGCRAEASVDVASCRDITCSGHGSCVLDGGRATCECEVGYRSDELQCVRGCDSAACVEPTLAFRQQICLNGLWDFQTVATEIQSPASDWPGPPDDGWSSMRVPGTWRYLSGRDNFGLTVAMSNHPGAWLRRSFSVPGSWNDGRRIKLLFLAVDWAHVIWLNGQKVHSSPSLGLCFEVDITDYVAYGGENTLAVQVQKNPDRIYEAGITRSVYLKTTPGIHVEFSHAIASVRDSTLTVRTRIRNETDTAAQVEVEAVVLDNGEDVLSLPAVTAQAPANGSVDVETKASWPNPILWGFGQYGQPHLYHLRTTVADAQGQSLDSTFDRFGFREFRAEGKKFLFNEKEYRIAGDLINRAWVFIDNPSYITAHYQAMRSAGLTFQRLHTGGANSFDTPYWYEVADELGHLVEAQLEPTQAMINSPAHLALWTSYVNYHFNHPSLVMWCPDNEYFSCDHPDPPPTCVDESRINVGGSYFVCKDWATGFNAVANHIRALDPTRIIDFNHGYMLFAATKPPYSWFDVANFQTFNIHPYGELSTIIANAKTSVDPGDELNVPTVVGEILCEDASWNWAWKDMLSEPIRSYDYQHSCADDYARHLADVRTTDGFAGSNWCSLESTGFHGYSTATPVAAAAQQPYAGPWSDRVLVRDSHGNIVAERSCKIEVPWPSVSGEGTKALTIRTSYGTQGTDGGHGHNINWFDSSHPAHFSTAVYTATEELAEGEPAGLGPERANEVVVSFGIDGVPVEGAYAYLVPQDGQAAVPSAVATAPDGTAWFRFWDNGRYLVVVLFGEQRYATEVMLSRPSLSATSGYDHIVWVDMDGIDLLERSRMLEAEPKLVECSTRLPAEMFGNGDLEEWTESGLPVGWAAGGTGAVSQASEVRHSGGLSAKLTGSVTQFSRPVSLVVGQSYRLSGWIYKEAGDDSGRLEISDGTSILKNLSGSVTTGTWTYVEDSYVAQGDTPGKPKTFYVSCINRAMGAGGSAYYDDVSLIAEPEPVLYTSVVTNGDMELWSTPTAVDGWNGTPPAQQEGVKKREGNYSAALSGNVGQLTRPITLAAGDVYELSGWILKDSGNSSGRLRIATSGYQTLIMLEGSEVAGEWRYVRTFFVATGAEYYLYCLNYYMGDGAKVYYDDVKLRRVERL